MKKNYIASAVLLVSCIFSFAQPVLNSTDFPANYSALIYSISNNQSLSPGNAGANQVWDFSTTIMPTQADRMITLVPVSTALYADSYPSANYCVEYTFSFQSSRFYSYYKLSPTGLELMGEVNEDWNSNYVLSNPETIFQFPYTYNTVIIDTYQYGGEDSSSITTTYDAYGTLILPYATYYNVIRQKRTESGYNFYTFFIANPYSIIVAGSFLPSDSNPVFFYKNTTSLSVNETNNENLISVYPNPANTIINLQIANAAIIDKVVITDLTGKIVSKQDHNTNLINVQNLSDGMYILEAFSENNKYSVRFIKE
jgi:hypothetical protein